MHKIGKETQRVCQENLVVDKARFYLCSKGILPKNGQIDEDKIVRETVQCEPTLYIYFHTVKENPHWSQVSENLNTHCEDFLTFSLRAFALIIAKTALFLMMTLKEHCWHDI